MHRAGSTAPRIWRSRSCSRRPAPRCVTCRRRAGGRPSPPRPHPAVLGIHAALLAAHPAVGGPQARAGTLRAIGTMGSKRAESFPDVPTLKELGYEAEYYQWNGLFTQAKVPEPIITIWREAV